MVFYLSNWITKAVGDFIYATCSACGSDVVTLLVKRRRWVSFLSIPLVPTSGARWYHTCPNCGATWELPDDSAEDARELSETTTSLIDGDVAFDDYQDRVKTFVNEHALGGDYEDFVAEQPDTRYIQ